MTVATGFQIVQSGLSILFTLLTNFYLLAAALIFRFLWDKYAQGLNTIPGHSLAGFSSLWRLIDV